MKGFDSNAATEKAARRRVSDLKYVDIKNNKLLDTQTQNFLRLGSVVETPPLLPNVPFFSADFSNYLKDKKFEIGAFAEQLLDLDEQIQQNGLKNRALLDDIQRELLVIDSELTEEEIKQDQNVSKTHFNTWVRAKDQGLDFEDKEWIVDFKTGLPFLAENILALVPTTGLTLPEASRINLSFSDVKLIGEETDFGSTEKPLVSTSPKNVIADGKIFKHIIVRQEFDSTTRKYVREPSYCTFLLEFPTFQLVNNIEIRPVSSTPMIVSRLSYVNEAGQEVTLNTLDLSLDTSITLLFEPVRAKVIKVQLEQKAVVTKGQFINEDTRIKKINELLKGGSWSQKLAAKSEVVSGRVFDFSIESISANLVSYRGLGCYRSQPLPIKNPIGLNLSSASESISVSNTRSSYGVEIFLEEGEVLTEFYIGCKLYNENNREILSDLIPVPDGESFVREMLPIIGGESRVKLFPDLLWPVEKLFIESATKGTSYEVRFFDPHGFTEEDYGKRFCMVASLSEPAFNTCTSSWTIVDDYTISFGSTESRLRSFSGLDFDGFDLSLDLSDAELTNFTPRPFGFLIEEVQPAILVYKESELLTIGENYQISLDDGETWLDEIPQDSSWYQIVSGARAGNFRVRIISPEYDKLYWIEYRVLSSQKLNASGTIRLKNNKVVFDKSLGNSTGTLQTVVVNRADNLNTYLTSVLNNYTLKVTENVS